MSDRAESELLEDLLNSEAWNQFLVKYLLKFKEVAILQLTTIRTTDSKLPPDDFIRGRLDVFNFLLNGLPAQLDQWKNPEKDVNNPRESDDSLPGVGDPYSEPTSQGE